MNKKKVMFLLAAFDKGGIEKVTLDIVNNLDPEKYDITIYTIWYGGYCQSLVKPYIKVKPFFFKRYVKGIIRLVDLLPPSILYRLFIRGKYDIEIAAGDGECSKIISGSTNKKSKKISWIHMDVIERGGRLKELRNRTTAKKIYDKFNKIVFVSKVCMDKFIMKFGKYPAMDVVYNPMPKSEIIVQADELVEDVDFDNRHLNLISVGRLVEQKGFDRLINCCNTLINCDKLEFNLYIVGEGSQRAELEDLIQKYNLSEYVNLIGFRENPYKYINKADIFVLSSRDESFSLAVGEAIILHKVIVATECAGIKEWIGDSVYGLMVENSEEGLYEGMKLLLGDEKIRKQYTNSVRERENKISFEDSLKQFENSVL